MVTTTEETVTIQLPKKLCLQLVDLLEAAAASGIMDCVWLMANILKRAGDRNSIALQTVTDTFRHSCGGDDVGEWTHERSNLTAGITVMLDRLYPRKP